MAPVEAKPPATARPPTPFDVTALRDRMKVLHDGQNHYLAFVPKGDDAWQPFFYGTFAAGDATKVLYAQRILGGGSEGDIAFNRSFWEPRVASRWQASFDFRDGQFHIQCDDRKTELKPLAEAETRALAAAATFYQPRWTRQAYALARDNAGTYYYVDRGREEQFNKHFRVFVGPRGKLRELPLTNVVSDSEGDVFATRSGALRLVLNKGESNWVQGKKETRLVHLAVEDNVRLIYRDLGVYLGEKLGTPCDDL